MDSFGKTWLESAGYMDAANEEADREDLPQPRVRSEAVQVIAEALRRMDRHLYSAIVYIQLAKEMGQAKNNAGVLLCAAKVMEHLNTIAKLSKKDLDEGMLTQLAKRMEQLPVKTVDGLRNEISLRVRRTGTRLGEFLEMRDFSQLGAVKESQDRVELLATLLDDELFLEIAKEGKGSFYVEDAAEHVYGPDETLDEVTRMEKLLVAHDLSPEDIRAIEAELKQ